MLYATLAVLFVILFGTSYALRKGTEPPAPPQASMPPEKQAEMRQMMEKKQKDMTKQQMAMRTMQMKKQMEMAALEKKRLAILTKENPGLKLKPQSTGADITDKWFRESPDGQAGIEQAAKEKQIQDKLAAMNSAIPTPLQKPTARAPGK